jgi:hypothetical protein
VLCARRCGVATRRRREAMSRWPPARRRQTEVTWRSWSSRKPQLHLAPNRAHVLVLRRCRGNDVHMWSTTASACVFVVRPRNCGTESKGDRERDESGLHLGWAWTGFGRVSPVGYSVGNN